MTFYLPRRARRCENFRVNALNAGGNGVCLTRGYYRKTQNRLTMKTVMQLGSTPAALLSYGLQRRKQDSPLDPDTYFDESQIRRGKTRRSFVNYLSRSITEIGKLLGSPTDRAFSRRNTVLDLTFRVCYFINVNSDSLRLFYCYSFTLCSAHIFSSSLILHTVSTKFSSSRAKLCKSALAYTLVLSSLV